MKKADQFQNDVVAPSQLRASPFNPRKTFEDLDPLADSIRVQGVLVPLLVRPVGDRAEFVDGGWVGWDHLEIVDGERRFRAAKLVKGVKIPVVVRQMSDEVAREIQLVTNDQRAAVKPSEKAPAYAKMVEELGLEEVATRTGVPLQQVRDLVAIAGLPEWFLRAVDREEIPLSTAALVAKVPGAESREQAAALVALGLIEVKQLGENFRLTLPEHFAGPLTFKDAKAVIRSQFVRKLSDAPFSRKALDLVPEAGACDACPKRAGNVPELVAEKVRADMCTDPDCYRAKVEAFRSEAIISAKKRFNAEPLDEVKWANWQAAPPGYCRLTDAVGETELDEPAGSWKGERAKQTVKDLLGDSGKVSVHVAFHPTTGKPAILVRTKDARKELERKGLMSKPERVTKEKSSPHPKGEGVNEPDGPYRLYRVTLNPDVMPAVEFDALEGTDVEDLREQAASAFMDWFDGVDWTDTKLIPRSFVTYERVPAPEIEQPAPPVSQPEKPAALDASVATEKIEHPKGEPLDGPIVCAPVGSLKLRDVPKFPAAAADVLESVWVVTLLDLESRSAACTKQHRSLSPHNLLRMVEAEFGLSLPFDQLMAAGDAIADHLVVKPAVIEKGKRKGKVKA